jgi:chromosome segregation ATPase
MYLQRLEIQGFKSFANKTTILFSEQGEGGRRGLTAIVGPNGSGKSNIADAMRWVMGEQSLKQLRGKKSEDVIFSGSDKRAKMGMAEVSLFLRNDSGFRIQDSESQNEDSIETILNSPEIVITRRLFRDGTSEYLLNGNRARLADINLLLAKANIGERGFTVIGQGMIDQFLFLSPEERKEAIDEAAGIRHLQIKKNEAERKLDATRENLREAEILLAEIEPRLRSLSRQVKRLSEREAMDSELKNLQSRHYGSLYRNIHKEAELLKRATSQAEKAVADKEVDLRTIQTKLNTLEKTETSSVSLLDFQKELEPLHAERQRLRDRAFEIRVAAERSKNAQLPMAAVIAGIESIHADEQALLSKIKNATTLEELELIKTAANALDARITELLGTIRGETRNKENEKNLAEVERGINEVNSKINAVQDKITNASKGEREQKSAFFALQREYQNMLEVVMRLRSDLGERRISSAKTEQRLEDLESEIKAEMQIGDITPLLQGASDDETNKVENPAFGAPQPESAEEAYRHIQRLKQQLAAIGGIDPEVVKEHGETAVRYETLKTQYDDLISAEGKLLELGKELDETIGRAFHEAFKKISVEFEKFFKILFNGGNAKLIYLEPETAPAPVEGEEVDPNAPAKQYRTRPGVDIVAQPPGKKVKSINVLSGGERALTAIALISAIIAVNPSPFVVLDEVDAALDEANSVRFADIVFELTEKTQFIVVTHNRYTMERAGIIYGVTMSDDAVSKILSIKLEEAVVGSTK